MINFFGECFPPFLWCSWSCGAILLVPKPPSQ